MQNSEIFRQLFFDNGIIQLNCTNTSSSLLDLFRESIVMADDGFPAIRLIVESGQGGFCSDLYPPYRDMVIAAGGTVKNPEITTDIICFLVGEVLTACQQLYYDYNLYVIGLGGTIKNGGNTETIYCYIINN